MFTIRKIKTFNNSEKTIGSSYFQVLLERRSGAVSHPFNVRHVTHVDEAFRWTGKSVEDTFELGDEIGRGSFAEVFRARHRETKFEVAAKVLRNMAGHARASSHMVKKTIVEPAAESLHPEPGTPCIEVVLDVVR